MTEYNTEWESTLTKCPIICSVLLWWPKYSCLGLSWCDPSIAALVCLDECLLIYSVVPPSLHWRGPDSVKCDAPSLVSVFRSSILSLHLDNNGRHAGAPLWMTWQRRLKSRLCFSPYILALLPGDKGELGGVLLVLSCARRMIAWGRRVWRKTRSQSSHWWHLRWSKQPQDMFPGHNSPQGLLLHTFTTLVRSHKRFSTEIIFYTKLESSGDYGCSSLRGVFESQ